MKCPHCGKLIGGENMISDEADLLFLLQDGRNVYRTLDGHWRYTYSGADRRNIDPHLIDHLIANGTLVQKYSNTTDCYRLGGNTIDVEASRKLREREGKNAPLVYVSGSKPVGGS